MSVSASVPSAPAAPGQAHGLGAPAGKSVGGATAAFDALMAAFFGQPGQPGAAAGAFPTVAVPGTAQAGEQDGKVADSDSEKKAGPDGQTQAVAGDLNLALLALAGPTPLVQLPQQAAPTPAAGEGGGAAGGGAAPTMPGAAAQGQAGAAPVDQAAATPQAAAPELAKAASDKLAEAAKPTPAQAAAPAISEQSPAAIAQAVAEAEATSPETAVAEAAAQPAAAQPVPPASGKPAAKPARTDAAKTAQAAPNAAVAPEARTGGAQPTPSAEQAAGEAKVDDAAGPTAKAADSKPSAPDAAPMTAETSPAPAQARDAAAPTHTATVRGSPETVAHLAAQIVKKLDSRSTRFDVELNPAGLGRVDVRVEIGAHGQVAAALSCDNPHAAAELKARASELQAALEQAGFDVSGGLSFDVASDQGGFDRGAWNQADNDRGQAFRGRAFQAALDTAGDAALAAASNALTLRRAAAAGVDVRI